MYDCGPQSLELASFFFFPSQVHTWYVVTGLSYKTCGCGYVRVHMLLQCMIECVVFTQSDLPFPLFFIYHYCCAELLALVAACLLSCFRFMHHSCTVCIVVSTLQVQVYTCVLWHVLGKGGRTHGPFICCSRSSLVLRDLHIVCAKKKKTLKKAAHFVPKSSQAQVNCNCGSIPNLNG